MPRTIRPKIGRPPHADPPVFVATNLPKSLRDELRELARVSGIPMSQHLSDAVAGYLWRIRQVQSHRPKGLTER